MKKIKLSQNQFALVDDDMYEELNKYKWHAQYYKPMKSFYAKRNTPMNNKGVRPRLFMHRVIMHPRKEEHVDHRNHNSLDNQRHNLRICTQQQNLMNKISRANSSSKYKGVAWHKRDKIWNVSIQVNKKRTHLGYFSSEKAGALAYNKKAKELHGEFAYLNKIE